MNAEYVLKSIAFHYACNLREAKSYRTCFEPRIYAIIHTLREILRHHLPEAEIEVRKDVGRWMREAISK